MIKTLINSFRVPELRKKIFFTLLIMVVFRIGSVIPVPFLDVNALSGMMGSLADGGAILSYLDTLSGGAFSQATIFAMSVSPYITASIVMQLMTVALPALERLQKEGEEGRKKLTAITRYLTIGIGLLQGAGFYVYLKNGNYGGQPIVKYTEGFEGVFTAIVIICCFTAGTALMMWLGEQINDKGVGNGISILMFAGIVSRMPSLINQLVRYIQMAISNPEYFGKFFIYVPLFVLMFFFMMWVIVFMNDAERRIPIQYSKRIVGRKMYAGQNSHIPLKIGIAGVMPIIFASSILWVPQIINFFARPTGVMKNILDVLKVNSLGYTIVYFFLILMFAYFYVAITYNPIEMANNLRQSNGVIPGIRPGKPTSDFLSKILSKVTLLGALFLAFIALLPIGFSNLSSMHQLSMGGTSIIILVGVALETVKQMESQLMMRHYKGFLD
ncbi:MAG: preprotein translocase subunit SecY [Clostridia bacterium]|nr:preprotein translocase subunit SecY [Clostridia bacterium]